MNSAHHCICRASPCVSRLPVCPRGARAAARRGGCRASPSVSSLLARPRGARAAARRSGCRALRRSRACTQPLCPPAWSARCRAPPRRLPRFAVCPRPARPPAHVKRAPPRVVAAAARRSDYVCTPSRSVRPRGARVAARRGGCRAPPCVLGLPVCLRGARAASRRSGCRSSQQLRVRAQPPCPPAWNARRRASCRLPRVAVCVQSARPPAWSARRRASRRLPRIAVCAPPARLPAWVALRVCPASLPARVERAPLCAAAASGRPGNRRQRPTRRAASKH